MPSKKPPRRPIEETLKLTEEATGEAIKVGMDAVRGAAVGA